MEWKLYDKDGNFLQEVNCQYDASDIAAIVYNAKIVQLDFDKKEAKIIEQIPLIIGGSMYEKYNIKGDYYE